MSTRELLGEGLLTLEDVKKERIQYFSDLAFEKRRAIVPDYEMLNAALGIYDEQETAALKEIVRAFREEFYRLKNLIKNAATIEEIESIKDNFPEVEDEG